MAHKEQNHDSALYVPRIPNNITVVTDRCREAATCR